MKNSKEIIEKLGSWKKSHSCGELRKRDIGKNIKEIFPDARIPIVAKTGLPEYGVIYNWRGSKHIVNRIPIKHGSKLLGVVTQVLFRDIQELNELSENINILKAKLESMRLEFNKCFQAKYTLHDIIGNDHEIRQLKKLAEQYSRTTLPVLTCSGKRGGS